MARKKKKGEDTPDVEGAVDGAKPAKASKGKSNLIPAVVVAVGLLGGAYFMKGGGGEAPAAAAEATEEPTEEVVVLGPVVEIDPITMNLADGHFLKVGIALQMAAPDESGAGGAHGAAPPAEGDAGPPTAPVLDAAISMLGSKTLEELQDPDERDEVKKALGEWCEEHYHGAVVGVYFTEFVMQ